DQRAHASTFGIALRYTVDGKPFTPPLDPAPQLTSVEADLTTLRANIAKQEAEAARYSGGLSQAMALSTVATSRQTEAMLEQKRRATIEFQDKDGLVIASRPSDTIGIPGNSDNTATGYALVRMPGAQNVARTVAN